MKDIFQSLCNIAGDYLNKWIVKIWGKYEPAPPPKPEVKLAGFIKKANFPKR